MLSIGLMKPLSGFEDRLKLEFDILKDEGLDVKVRKANKGQVTYYHCYVSDEHLLKGNYDDFVNILLNCVANALSDIIINYCEPILIQKIIKEELIMAMESSQTLLSLNDIAYQDDGSPIFFIDQIGTDEKDESTLFDRIALKEALSKLKKEERQIIILRYFKDLTQVQVAKMLGKTQVQVSREEKKILKKIRCFLS
jgi:RNA polymerase sigma factor (sigma-70 family)